MAQIHSFSEDSRVKLPALLTLARLGFSYLSLKDVARKDFALNSFVPHALASQKTQNATNTYNDYIIPPPPTESKSQKSQAKTPTQHNTPLDAQGNLALSLQSPQSYLFAELFCASLTKINPHATQAQIQDTLREILLELDYDDVGRAFYARLTSTHNGIKLIDFENFANNTFHSTTELTYKNGDDEFRPDITLLINGLPLAFIEVKIPHNKEGILSERARMHARLANPKFKNFFNALQILVFSNNQEYDNTDIEPMSGAFYATASADKLFLNRFREQDLALSTQNLPALDEAQENAILQDNNLISIKHTPEFSTNKDISTPTNRLLISLFSKPRLAQILKYGIAFVEKQDNQGKIAIQKHIVRYQQFFALNALKNALDNGVKKGIIWHTQGSGKTAFAFYSVRFLSEYFARKNILVKFYFIVDRLDLLTQAVSEFEARGLGTQTNISKQQLQSRLHTDKSAISNAQGTNEITVINIQKIPPDTQIPLSDYNVKIQRVYFIDEAHRSYAQNGSYLANLLSLDKEAIFISLTGTPLLASTQKVASKAIWGDYIHQYYYNDSIADGYTLRLIREDIQTRYKESLRQAIAEITIQDKDLAIQHIYAHKKFVTPMLDFIANDFKTARITHNDSSLGAMIVCSSSEQAKALFEIFTRDYKNHAPHDSFALNSATLILHDIDDKSTRTRNITEFKEGKIDLLIVYNMLLTGFDAPRLKKLYLDRKIKDHNLLQTLSRVNRPYKDFRYGYIVDFADISKEFDKANQAYFNELQSELGDDFEKFSQIFKSEAQIREDVESIKLALFDYDTRNLEIFSRQMSEIADKAKLYELRKALELAKELQNAIRIQGDDALCAKFDFSDFTIYSKLLNEVERKIATLNFKEALDSKTDITGLLNLAMEDIIFSFIKVNEQELQIADSYKSALTRTREALQSNFDKADPMFLSLKDALLALFAKKDVSQITSQDLQNNTKALDSIFAQITELNRTNALIAHKYNGDYKFTRIHKRLKECIAQNLAHSANATESKKLEMRICEALQRVKESTDAQILDNESILDNEAFFEAKVKSLVAQHFSEILPALDSSIDNIATLIANEYFSEHSTEVA